MHKLYYSWSAAKQSGYNAYYHDVDECDNPFDFYEDHSSWSEWCDGHMEAYCEDEGK